jgi:hypothetical protein
VSTNWPKLEIYMPQLQQECSDARRDTCHGYALATALRPSHTHQT